MMKMPEMSSVKKAEELKILPDLTNLGENGKNISIETIVQIISNIFDVYLLPFLPNVVVPNIQNTSGENDSKNFLTKVQPQINIIFLRQLVKNYSYTSVISLCQPGNNFLEFSYEQIVELAISVFSRLHLL